MLQQLVLDDAGKGSLGSALGSLADSDRRACDAGHQQRQQRQQRQQPQTRSQPRRPCPELASRRPRSNQKRSPTTGEKRRATSATSSTCSAAMTRRQWRSSRPRTGRLPSCRTASRARPCLFHPSFPTHVKQTGASLGTPGSSHQLADPSLIATELRTGLQLVWQAGLRRPLPPAADSSPIWQRGVVCHRADEEGISSALQEAALTDEEEEEQQEVAEGVNNSVCTPPTCSVLK